MKENYDQIENAQKGYEPNDTGREWIKRANTAFSQAERYNAQKTWALLSEFILPSQNRAWFGDITKGIRRDRRLFDSVPVMAARDLATAMHSTITNPSTHWSKLSFRDIDLDNDREATDWLDKTVETFHNHLNDSNFDEQVGRCYAAFVGLGSMIMFQDDDFRFYAWHLAETAWSENYKGVVDTVYRKFKMTISQASDKFGIECLPEEWKEKLEKQPDLDVDIYHCIYPRDKTKIKYSESGLADGKNRPFASLYIASKDSKILMEDGYYELPVYVCRWQTLPGEIYGYSPAHIALPDVRSLNKIKEDYLMALALSVRPPIFVNQQNNFQADFRPAGINVVRDINGIKEFVTQSRFDIIENSIELLQKTIQSVFYMDKLLLPPRTETGEMTAYEIQQRLQQMQQILGPVLSRLNYEFLTPLVMRSLGILQRQGKIEPIPASVVSKLMQKEQIKKRKNPDYKQKYVTNKNGKVDIEYDVMFVNSLARSQQMSELQNVQAWVQESAQLAQVRPDVLDNLNVDNIVAYSAKIRTIPENLLVDPQTMAKQRQQKAKAQQMQMAAQTGEQGSNIVKNLADAHGTIKQAQNNSGGNDSEQ